MNPADAAAYTWPTALDKHRNTMRSHVMRQALVGLATSAVTTDPPSDLTVDAIFALVLPDRNLYERTALWVGLKDAIERLADAEQSAEADIARKRAAQDLDDTLAAVGVK